MSLEAIRYKDGELFILDQLLLPNKSIYISVKNTEDGWNAIKKMQVRGAPAIAVVGCLSLAAEIYGMEFESTQSFADYVNEKMAYLVSSRPTAVNIVDAEHKVQDLLNQWRKDKNATAADLKSRLLAWIEGLQAEDVTVNQALGRHGADAVLQETGDQPATVLTHCNTGALATAGYGTALGVVRCLAERGRLAHCYCTETRPYNQGSRLTAYELVTERLPATLICDNMAAALMTTHSVTAVMVGADRVVANGDTANKIGTYQLAIIAKYHEVPFYVVAPSTSVDLSIKQGSDITIEERPAREMTTIKDVQLAPSDINCWNPAFDVTPADLITGGIVTEFGVFKPQDLEVKLTAALKKK